MTVIATLITSQFTAHASDSLLTRRRNDGTYEPVEYKRTKIVCVPRWAGAIAYFGLAKSSDGSWSTLKWLHARVAEARQFANPDAFAHHLRVELEKSLSAIRLGDPLERGIGLHFTAYEHVGDYKIPELFYITNFESTKYNKLHADGIHVTRETFGTIANIDERPPDHAMPKYRRRVRKWLAKGHVLSFNNGDPILFNPVSSALFDIADNLYYRRTLAEPKSAPALRYLAKWPIETIKMAQKRLMSPGYQVVGGKIHDLSVDQNGDYQSDTGDNGRPSRSQRNVSQSPITMGELSHA